MASANGPLEAAGLSPVKQALLEIRELRARLDAAESARRTPIAIVGMGCRFPGGCDGPDSLWRALVEGRDAISPVPADRWDADALFDPDPARPGRITTRWGGFIDGVDRFDPAHFGISPLEAMGLDPQQRLLLEVAWEAIEHAGYAPDRLAGSATGVFVGIGGLDYIHAVLDRPTDAYNPFVAQGISHAAGSGRLAYTLGLQGPAVSLDTACSSSLMAVHLAVQSLRNAECRMALAGGVNVMLTPNMHIALSRARMLAPDGRCKTFDARADGFIRSEGCGVVVLKRLDDAIADGDAIHAVILGSATNQDGRSSGMTAPNGPAQEAVIRAALANAGVAPDQVGYVEAHGTGTELGDPIEVRALGHVLGPGRGPDTRLRIGSLKTNLGHMEAAAGVAGLMKAALVLRRREIPPHLHLTEPNPHIPWRDLPIDVPTELTPFPGIDGRPIAGVSSFGFTGSNVHVVLEAPPARLDARPEIERPLHVLKVSARHAEGLETLASKYGDRLVAAGAGFADVCYTSTVGRADLPHRLVVVAADAEQARARLAARHADARLGDEATDGVVEGYVADPEPPEVAFLFTGHGAQYAGMGRRLFETQPTFRAAMEECDTLLRPHLSEPLLAVLYPENPDGARDRLATMTYAQPALFAVEYALARLWRSWGIEPTAVLGHSVGEYVAACVAGVFGLEDGLQLVATRGRLMDGLAESGGMAALFAGTGDVEPMIGPFAGELDIAAVNGPTEVVVSGTRRAVEAVIADAERRGIEFRRLAVAAAAHSHLLDPILDEFEAKAATIRCARPAIDLVSCILARPLTADEAADPRYWRRHLRETVRFADALAALHAAGPRVFVEVGPHPTLCGMGARCLPDADALWLPSLREGREDWDQILESLARAYVGGVAVEWERFERDYAGSAGKRTRARVALPTNAWRHQRYWIEGGVTAAARSAGADDIWRAADEAGRTYEAQGPLDLDLGSFPRRWHALDRLTTAVAAVTLRRMSAFDAPVDRHTADSLVEKLGVEPAYRGLLARWLRRLAGAGLLDQDDHGRFGPAATLADEDIADAWREAEAAMGEDGRFMVEYVRRCADAMPAVLTGRLDPLETLFPAGSTATADMLYRDWAVVRYYNALTREIVGAIARAWPGTAGPRVLELGGGTGGTTSAVLPALAGRASVYHFTDVSELFLAQAEDRFADYAFLRCGILDIDRDPDAQGFDAEGFDVVVAANVLHAARDLPAALRRARRVLGPGGMLVAFEITEYMSWFDATTALLEGWESYDDGVRSDHPVLTAEEWREQLGAAGFERVATFPRDGSPATVLGLQIFVAQVPGEPAAAAPPGLAGAAAAEVMTDGSDRAAAADPRSRRDAAALEFVGRLADASPAERDELLTGFVRGQIVQMLRLEPSAPVDRKRRLMDLGLDSLMAVELRGRLGRGLALDDPLPATLVFDYPTIDAIVGLLRERLDPALAADVRPADDPVAAGAEVRLRQTAAASADRGDAAADMDELDEAEVEARLLARLEALEESDR